MKLIRFMVYNVLSFLGDPLRRLPFLLIIKYSIFLRTKLYFLGKKGSVGNKPEKGDHLEQGQWSTGMEYRLPNRYTLNIEIDRIIGLPQLLLIERFHLSFPYSFRTNDTG